MWSKTYLDHNNWSSYSEFPAWRQWYNSECTLNGYYSNGMNGWDDIPHSNNGDTWKGYNQYTNSYTRQFEYPFSINKNAYNNDRITYNHNSTQHKPFKTSSRRSYHGTLHRLKTQKPIKNLPKNTVYEESIKSKEEPPIQLLTLKARETGNAVKSNEHSSKPVCELDSEATLHLRIAEPQKITQFVPPDSSRTSKSTLLDTTQNTPFVLLDPQKPMQYAVLKTVEANRQTNFKSQQTLPFVDSQSKRANPIMQSNLQESMQYSGKYSQQSLHNFQTRIPVTNDIGRKIKQKPVQLRAPNMIDRIHSEKKWTRHLNTTLMQGIPPVLENTSDCRIETNIRDNMVEKAGLSLQQSKKQDLCLDFNPTSGVYQPKSFNVKNFKSIEDKSYIDYDEDPVVKTEEFMDEGNQSNIESGMKFLESTINNCDSTSKLNCSSMYMDRIPRKSKCKGMKKNNSESDEGILLGADILEKSLSDIVVVQPVGMHIVRSKKLYEINNSKKEVKGKAKVEVYMDEGFCDKGDLLNKKVEPQDCLGKIDIPVDTSTRKPISETSPLDIVLQNCNESYKPPQVVNQISSTKDEARTGISKDDIRNDLASNGSARTKLKELDVTNKAQKQQRYHIKPAVKNDCETSSDLSLCVKKGNAIDLNLAHSNFVSKIDAARKLIQEVTPTRNVLGPIECHERTSVNLKNSKASPVKIRRKMKITCNGLKPKYNSSSDVVDRCPRGHFLKPLLATFNLQTGQIIVPCKKCKSIIYMQSKVNRLL